MILNYCLLTRTVYAMKNFMNIGNILIQDITLKTVNIFVIIIKKYFAGKMKDEYGRNVFKEFTGLTSKMHSIFGIKNNEKSTHKGHNSFIKYEEFGDTLFNKKVHRHKMRRIKSKNHNLITYESNKTCTSCFDDKRYIKENGIDTLPYGHKDIPK